MRGEAVRLGEENAGDGGEGDDDRRQPEEEEDRGDGLALLGLLCSRGARRTMQVITYASCGSTTLTHGAQFGARAWATMADEMGNIGEIAAL